jgi:succinyl-CoA synthetase beta subunit
MGDQIQDGGGEGHPVEHVYVSESVEPEREWYLAMTVDRENYCPAIILSDKTPGAASPESVTIPFRLTDGITPKLLERVATEMNLPPNATESLKPVLGALYSIFSQKDATLLEINRLALLPNGTLTCLDASFTFDDAAHKRQPELFSLRDTHQEVSEEVQAENYGLVYVRMEGDIGNVVNGAGLAMATNDAIGLYGGKSANFLDGGGQATKETMVKAFGIIVADERVKVILVNIYGGELSTSRIFQVQGLTKETGITDGRMIAESIIGAAEELGPLRVPMVVRLQGTNSEEGLKLVSLDISVSLYEAHLLTVVPVGGGESWYSRRGGLWCRGEDGCRSGQRGIIALRRVAIFPSISIILSTQPCLTCGEAPSSPCP